MNGKLVKKKKIFKPQSWLVANFLVKFLMKIKNPRLTGTNTNSNKFGIVSLTPRRLVDLTLISLLNIPSYSFLLRGNVRLKNSPPYNETEKQKREATLFIAVAFRLLGPPRDLWDFYGSPNCFKNLCIFVHVFFSFHRSEIESEI